MEAFVKLHVVFPNDDKNTEEEAEKEQECYHCAHEAAFKIAR